MSDVKKFTGSDACQLATDLEVYGRAVKNSGRYAYSKKDIYSIRRDLAERIVAFETALVESGKTRYTEADIDKVDEIFNDIKTDVAHLFQWVESMVLSYAQDLD